MLKEYRTIREVVGPLMLVACALVPRAQRTAMA